MPTLYDGQCENGEFFAFFIGFLHPNFTYDEYDFTPEIKPAFQYTMAYK